MKIKDSIKVSVFFGSKSSFMKDGIYLLIKCVKVMKVSKASSLRWHLGLTNRIDGPERDKALFTLTNTSN